TLASSCVDVSARRRWQKSPPHRGEHEVSRKATAQGSAGMLPLNLYARVRFLECTLHTRPRVQRAPGLPCALCLLEVHGQSKPRTQCYARMRDCIRNDVDGQRRIPCRLGSRTGYPGLPCKNLKFKIYAEPSSWRPTDVKTVAFLPCTGHGWRARHWPCGRRSVVAGGRCGHHPR